MPYPKLTDPDLSLECLMKEWPQTISVFIGHRMLCVGCMVSPFHTVTDACREYRLNEDAFVCELKGAMLS